MKRCVDYSNLKLPSLLETAYWDLMTKKQANTENGEEEEQIKKIICDPHGMKAIYFHKNLHGSLFQTLYDKMLTKILKTVKSLMSAFHVLISNKSLIFYLSLFRVTVVEIVNYIGKYEKTTSLVQQRVYRKQAFMVRNIPKEMPLIHC